MVKGVKGVSSHLMTHKVGPREFFKWQGCYSAFTLRKEDVPIVERYIRHQKERHATGNLSGEGELPVAQGAATEHSGR